MIPEVMSSVLYPWKYRILEASEKEREEGINQNLTYVTRLFVSVLVE